MPISTRTSNRWFKVPTVLRFVWSCCACDNITYWSERTGISLRLDANTATAFTELRCTRKRISGRNSDTHAKVRQPRMPTIGTLCGKKGAGIGGALLLLFAPMPLAARAPACPIPAHLGEIVRSAYPVVADYRTVLIGAHCTGLRCTHQIYDTYSAELDTVLFDRDRPAVSASALRFILSTRPTPPGLQTAEDGILRRDFRKAFRAYLDDFRTNVSSVRSPDLDTHADTEHVASLLHTLARGPATPRISDSLAEIADRHPNQTAPLLYLGAALLERGCRTQALQVYRTIPYLRPVVRFTYSGVDTTALRLALAIDANTFHRSPADRAPRPAPNPAG